MKAHDLTSAIFAAPEVSFKKLKGRIRPRVAMRDPLAYLVSHAHIALQEAVTRAVKISLGQAAFESLTRFASLYSLLKLSGSQDFPRVINFIRPPLRRFHKLL